MSWCWAPSFPRGSHWSIAILTSRDLLEGGKSLLACKCFAGEVHMVAWIVRWKKSRTFDLSRKSVVLCAPRARADIWVAFSVPHTCMYVQISLFIVKHEFVRLVSSEHPKQHMDDTRSRAPYLPPRCRHRSLLPFTFRENLSGSISRVSALRRSRSQNSTQTQSQTYAT